MSCSRLALIKVKKGSGIKPSLKDIVSNPKHLQFKEVDPANSDCASIKFG